MTTIGTPSRYAMMPFMAISFWVRQENAGAAGLVPGTVGVTPDLQAQLRRA